MKTSIKVASLNFPEIEHFLNGKTFKVAKMHNLMSTVVQCDRYMSTVKPLMKIVYHCSHGTNSSSIPSPTQGR